MQNSSGAFPWFAGGPDSFYITRHIVSGFAKLKRLDVELDSRNLLGKAIKYLDKEFLEWEQASRNDSINKEFYKSNIAFYYLEARKDYLEQFPFSAELKPMVDKVVQLQKEDWLQKSLYDKAALALVLNSFGEKETAVKILNALKESAVKTED